MSDAGGTTVLQVAGVVEVSQTSGAPNVPTPGTSAYDTAIANGFAGTEEEWLNSLVGGGISILNGRAEVLRNLSIGNNPPGSLYELNAGGQDVVTPGLVQIINIDGVAGFQSSLIEGAQFGDDGKPVVLNFTKSRGTGIIGDANMNRLGLQGDRLFVLAINSGGYKTGYVDLGLPRGGSLGGHAGYLTWTQEYDTNTADPNNSVHAMFHLVGQSPSGTYLGSGGIQGNCMGQVYFSGANQAQHSARDRYRGLVEIGAGTGVGEKYQALSFNSAPLIDPAVNPEALFDGGIEYYAGNLYLTHSFVAGVLDRRVVLTSYQPTFTTVTQPAGLTVTERHGVDWVEFTVLVGAADVTAGSVCRINISPVLPGVPIVVGSYTSATGLAGAVITQHPVLVFAGANNKLTASLAGGSMQADATYVFTLIWRLP